MSAWCSCPSTPSSAFPRSSLLPAKSKSELSGRYKSSSPSLCLDNSLPRRCTFDFQTESSHRAHPERNSINMVLKAGTRQTWPVAVLIQPTTTSPAAGPPASSWCFKPSPNSLLCHLSLPSLPSPRTPCTLRFLENKITFHERNPPRFATIWRMMLEPARDQRSCKPNSGDSTSQFSLLWLGEQS